MAWKLQTLQLTPPQEIASLQKTIEDFYNNTLKPAFGPNYPPTLGGTIGTTIQAIETILGNIQSAIVDPFSAVIGVLTSQLKKVIDDLENTGTQALIIHPNNCSDSELKRVQLDASDIPDNIKQLESSIMSLGTTLSERDQAFFKNPNFTAVNIKTLSPFSAIDAAVRSLDDTNDPQRPQYSNTAYVYGFGVLLTSKSYIDIQKIIDDVKNFFNFKDLENYEKNLTQKFSAKIADLEDWKIILDEYTKRNSNIAVANIVSGATRPADYSIASLRKLFDKYKLQFPDRSITFSVYLDTIKSVDLVPQVFAQKPNWMGVSVANTITPIKDFFDLLKVLIDQLDGFTQAGTSSVNEAISIIKKRVAQFVSIVTEIAIAVEKFVEMPSLTKFYTFQVEGVGGNNLIKKELKKINVGNDADNDFSILLLWTGGSVSGKSFTLLYDIFQSYADSFKNLNLLKGKDLKVYNPVFQLPPAIAPITKPIPFGLENVLKNVGGLSVVDPPRTFRVTEITNGSTYPFIAPFWDEETGVVITSFLQKDSNTPAPYTKGTPIIAAGNYTLTLNSVKDNNKLETITTYTFTINPAVTKPPKIFPINVQEGQIITDLPFAISWLEQTGFNTTGYITKTDVMSPVEIPYFKGQNLNQNGLYILRIVSAYNSGPILTEETIINFSIDTEATIPDPVEIVGLTNFKVYTEPVTLSWEVPATYTITALLKKDNDEFESFISGTEISVDGVYRLEVTTEKPNGKFITVLYTFVLDQVAPSNVVVDTIEEINDQTFTTPTAIYWDIPSGFEYVAKLFNGTDTIDYAIGTVISDLNTYTLTVTLIKTLDTRVTNVSVSTFTIS